MKDLPCSISRCDDGSFLIEIYGPDWRIGVVVDVEAKDSGWHMVSRENNPNLNVRGDIGDHDKLFTTLNAVITQRESG